MSTDYFVNHDVGRRWPFTIYHQPMEEYLVHAVRSLPPDTPCLNVGCGFFSAYPRVARHGRWYACDNDPRCIAVVRQRHPDVVADVCGALPEYPAGTFGLIVATEVIEHIPDARTWLARLFTLCRPGARVLLSTPNYGVSLLPVVEYTLLEVLARARGFSRFGIHPNKYTRRRLRAELRALAPPGADVRVVKLSLGMVLMGDVRFA